jgi:hypothetical protein
MTYPQQPGGWTNPSSGQQPYPGMPGYPPPSPYGYLPVQPSPPTNGMAIAALVVACVGVLGLCAYGLGGWIGAIGAILGHVARRQIRERGDAGDGMALAGIIVGWIATALFALAAIGWGVGIWYAATHSDSDTSNFIQLVVG